MLDGASIASNVANNGIEVAVVTIGNRLAHRPECEQDDQEVDV